MEVSNADPASEITSSVDRTPDRLRMGTRLPSRRDRRLRTQNSLTSLFSVPQNASTALNLQCFQCRHASHFKDHVTERYCALRCDKMFCSRKFQYANRQGNGALGRSKSVIFCPYLQHSGEDLAQWR